MSVCNILSKSFLKQNIRNLTAPSYQALRTYCANVTTEKDEATPKGGFAKAFEKYTAPEVPEPKEEQTFASLLRNSKFIDVSCYWLVTIIGYWLIRMFTS